MTARVLVSIGLLTALLGCRTTAVSLGREGWITTDELAETTGLGIRKRAADREVLYDDLNTVVVFPGPRGNVYVNGRGVGPSGSSRRMDGRIYLLEDLVPDIRAALRRAPPKPPEPPKAEAPPKVNQKPRAEPVKTAVVVIDPGHGGRDPGAIGPAGTEEEDVNLALALALSDELHTFDVRMTRVTDEYVPLFDRADLGNRAGADLFLSLHADADRTGKARGFTVFVRRGADTRSRRAAAEIERAMRKTGLLSRGIREANFVVLRESKGPAVLVEAGFLSHPAEERLLIDPAFRERLAKALADAIRRFL